MSLAPSLLALSTIPSAETPSITAGPLATVSPQQRIFAEFRASAIPDPLTLVNVSWAEGNTLVQLLAEEAVAASQNVTSYVTMPARRILNRYEFARAGGWVAFGCTLDGYQGSVAYVKPLTPRQTLDGSKIKTIKYETPAKTEASPLLPWLDETTTQTFYQTYGGTPEPGETIWQVAQRCNWPIAICEGFKKALSMIAHGILAIAIRGITQWHRKNSTELHPALAHFATFGRTVYIVFDQDEKVSTQRQVQCQIIKLGDTLEHQGVMVRVPTWEKSLGKGIDDALVRAGDEAHPWLQNLLSDADTFKTYKQLGRRLRASQIIGQLSQLSFPVERQTQGEYLPLLPAIQPQAIHVLSASMNAGKTTRIGQDWVQYAKSQGWNTLVLCPLNSLGQQTAQAWGLPHIRHLGNSQAEQQALWSIVNYDHGIVMCPESLHRLPNWFWSRPLLLVCDEANQVLESLHQGNTLGSRWADIEQRFAAVLKHAATTGAIVLSEDGIPERAVKFVQTVSDAAVVRVFRHKKRGKPWHCTLYNGDDSGYRALMLKQVRQGQRIIIVTSSQREAKRLERAMAKQMPGVKVVRIDSETNEKGAFNCFFDGPDTWLAAVQPDVLILTPSAKSGVSIEGNIAIEQAYFTSVWGYFPALGTDTHMQLLGRYRPSVPRHIYVPPFILADSDEALLYPRAIARRLSLNAKASAGIHAIKDMLNTAEQDNESRATLESAIYDYLADAMAVSGNQKSIAHDALVQRLQAEGHTISYEKVSKDGATQALWQTVQEELWREDADAISTAIIDPSHNTPEWARRTLDAVDVSAETRLLATKVLWREEFPGLLFDDSEVCYRAFCQNHGSLRRGVVLQAKAENLEATKLGERAATLAIFNDSIRAFHRLPRSYIQALLLSKLGVLDLLNGTPYSNLDPRAIHTKQVALQFASEIYYWLRLQIKPDQTPVEICNKLLKKLELKGEAIARPGRRGEQKHRIYQVEGMDDPVRQQLLEALRQKLQASVSTVREKENDLYQTMDTAPPPLTLSPPGQRNGPNVIPLPVVPLTVPDVGDGALQA